MISRLKRSNMECVSKVDVGLCRYHEAMIRRVDHVIFLIPPMFAPLLELLELLARIGTILRCSSH